MQFEFASAGRIVFGTGVIAQVGSFAQSVGTRALIVTGRSQERSARVERVLSDCGMASAVFHLEGEPTTRDAEQATDQARQHGADLVIGIGGGSAIDLGKATAALMTNDGVPLDYLEVVGRGKRLQCAAAPYIAIPTTAGTGSEVTKNAVLESPEHHVKVSLRDESMLPRIALVDPELSLTVPPRVTASTGFDAMAQVIEPYLSCLSNPLTDGLCEQAIVRGARALPRAYANGSDLEARQEMSLVSLFGGLALANAKLGAVHGFAGPLGGMYSAPHGALCAALLPHVLEANLRALKEREPNSTILQKCKRLGVLLTGRSDAGAEAAVDWAREMGRTLGIEPLRAYGVGEKDFDAIADKAARASSMKGNPLPLEREELLGILAASL